MKVHRKWPTITVGEITDRVTVGIATSTTQHYRESGVPILRNLNIRAGSLDDADLMFISPEFDEANKGKRLRANDVITVRTGFAGVSCVVPPKYEGAQTFTTLIISPRQSDLDSRFICHHLNSLLGDREFYRLTGDAGRANLNATALREYTLDLPSLPEQRKIADILTTWDEALEKLDALIEAQERRKKALMQQLLTGTKRLPEFTRKWKTMRLGDVLEPITRPTAKPEGTFLAAGIRSHGKGVFLKPDFVPANIALDELFELKTGDLVVNITFAWEGAAAIVPPEADGALVSHRFPVFGFRAGKAARSFFRHYIRTHRFVFDCGLASPGGAGRNRVLSKSAFLDIELPLPSVDEQQRIGDILDTADQQLTLLRTQRIALDQQKRGLMQRLLTGKLRVKIAAKP